MSVINVKNTVGLHLFRERFEVLLAVCLPFVFMIESGYACTWILTGGHLALDFATFSAFIRGFGIEAFTFVCFKLVRIFWIKGRTFWASLTSAVLPFLLGLAGVTVSAGMNLGFMIQSPEMRTVMASISSFMPSPLVSTFRLGLGLLFPVGVALFALFDIRHLIEEMIISSDLDEDAMVLTQAQELRKQTERSIKQAARNARDRLGQIAETSTQRIVDSVAKGDMSFGADVIRRKRSSTPQGQPSVVRVTQAPQGPTPAMSHRPTTIQQPAQVPQLQPGKPAQLPPIEGLQPKQPMPMQTGS